MLVFGKKIAYWRERLGGIVLGILISIPVFFVNPQISDWKDFVKEIPSLGMCAFGFLLTFLGIILQGQSQTIEWMKSRDTLFKRFVAFNKRIVILSIIISIYSYFLAFFNFEWILHTWCYLNLFWDCVQKIMIALFLTLAIWFLYDLLYFIKIFYLLIKKA
jgi:hypothetical protein